MKEIIQHERQERLAYRLYDLLPDILKRVDAETYSLFRTIILSEGNEWDDAFSDASPADQLTVKNIATQFFEVTSSLFSDLLQVFKEYEPTQNELSSIPLDTISIPADIPSIDVFHFSLSI